MDIDSLRSFLAFVDTGSFTRAAKQIARTQSAFSAQMRKLEQEIGSELFVKEGRNLALSEAGIRLVNHAHELLERHDKALLELKKFQHKQPLRLGCPEDYNDQVLPKLMQALLAAKPTCSIQVFNEPSVVLRQWLDEGKLDAAIVTRSANSEEGYWITSDQGVWICAQPDAEIVQRSPLPLALFQTDCRYHSAAIDSLTKRGVPFHLVACCNTSSAQRAIVRQGLAVGAMGRLSVTDDLTILSDFPPLPAVDIVLLVAAKSHPLLPRQFLSDIGELFTAPQAEQPSE